MDVRETPEQAELRRTARQLARELGPGTVADLDDEKRTERLAEAVRDAGWLELREDDGEGSPLASGVEASIIADALAGAVADTAFTGPVLAADLLRRVGAERNDAAPVAFDADLVGVAVVAGGATTEPLYAIDCGLGDGGAAYVLVAEGDGHRIARVETGETCSGTDLTRTLREVPVGASIADVAGQARTLTRADLDAWTALGLALTSADLVGGMRGVLDHAVSYASERRQYGVPIGSFQAVQHLLAEARCLMEGAYSATLHAAWAVDSLRPAEACEAGRVAKTYAARAARTVSETAVQVYGGMGNTWECIVHVYLRRALLASRWFGDDGCQLQRLQADRLGLGGAHGLS